MTDRRDLKRYQSNLQDERNSAALYRAIAGYEKNPKIAEVYRKLAGTEDAHAEAWEKRLQDAGVDVPVRHEAGPFRPCGGSRRFSDRASDRSDRIAG